MDEQFQAQILNRLNVLIALQLDSGEGTSLTTKICRLRELGLTAAEIGSILGKKPNYVSAVLGRVK